MESADDALSIAWDPRDPSSTTKPRGNFESVLASLEELIAERETAELQGAKAITLLLLDRPSEQIIDVLQRFAQLGGEAGPLRTLDHSRLLIAQTLHYDGQYAAAAQASSDVASFYGTDEDPFLRGIAAYAIQYRIRALIRLGDFDEAVAAWRSLCSNYGADDNVTVRTAVAAAGQAAAVGFLKADRTDDASRAADEVARLYENDTDAMTRAHVVAAMIVRYSALPRRRLLARSQALTALFHFVGSNPEPEVVEAIRETHPGSADWVLRKAHDAH